MIKDMTCLIHSMKIFALTFQSTLFVTLREIYRNGRNSNKQSHHKANKRSTNKHKDFSNKTRSFEVQRCRCARRWSVEVNSRESTDKDSSVRNCDHRNYEFKVNIMPTWQVCESYRQHVSNDPICQKNHVKRNTTTQVIVDPNLNWIWL